MFNFFDDFNLRTRDLVNWLAFGAARARNRCGGASAPPLTVFSKLSRQPT
jgi:hypothetical protein